LGYIWYTQPIREFAIWCEQPGGVVVDVVERGLVFCRRDIIYLSGLVKLRGY
jgi:hypothetical protein